MKKVLLFVMVLSLAELLCAQRMPRLHAGDTIAFVAPSAKIDSSEVLLGLRFFESKGFHVIVPEGIFLESSGFAGTVVQRTAEVQQMLDHPQVKAIVCVRGGYGAVSLLDSLDFTAFRQHPKWICGFSDITAFHSHLHTLGYPSLHSVMPITMKADDLENEYNQSLIKALKGKPLHYDFAPNDQNRPGKATAPVVGGNLSLLYSMLESVSSINTDGKILFIEDVGENIYHIHRMLVALDRAGKLKNLKGLIVGGMTKIKVDDYFYDTNLEAVIMEVCGKYDYPVCFDFPAGHGGQNYTLRLGCPATLIITPNRCSLVFE